MDRDIAYIEKLFPRINDIKDEDTKKKVVSVWLDAWQMGKFEKIEDVSQWEPAKEEINISNVDHTNQVLECAIAVAEVARRVQKISIDMDTLIAAAILHDVDKILIFEPSSGNTTPEGNYLPHAGLGSNLVLNAGLPLKVAHAVAAHSPASSIPPKTSEAAILAVVDDLVTTIWTMNRNVEINWSTKP